MKQLITYATYILFHPELQFTSFFLHMFSTEKSFNAKTVHTKYISKANTLYSIKLSVKSYIVFLSSIGEYINKAIALTN